MKTFIYVTGGKGGIGKSLVALALADYSATNGSVLLIDADPNNSDSYTPFNSNKEAEVTAIQAKIRSEDADGQVDTTGISTVFDNVLIGKNDTVIIDAPAGDTTLLASAGSFIVAACKEMKARSIFVWLVDSIDKSPVNTIGAAWNEIKEADTIVMVKNYSKGTNFQFFDESKTMADINKSANVIAIDFPKIAVRLIENIKIDRMTWKKITTDTPIGNRVEGQRVQKILHNTFKGAGL